MGEVGDLNEGHEYYRYRTVWPEQKCGRLTASESAQHRRYSLRTLRSTSLHFLRRWPIQDLEICVAPVPAVTGDNPSA
jgi:hypothetical protein